MWWLFLAIYCVVFLILAIIACVYANEEWEYFDEEEKKNFSRGALLIPVWPLVLVFAVIYGLCVLVSIASLGDFVQKKNKQKEKENGETQSENH